MRALAVAALTSVIACGDQAAPMFPAGSTYDDGHGDLAMQSMQLVRLEPARPEAGGAEPSAEDADEADPCSLAADGADAAYGGSAYAGFVVPSWRPTAVERRPRYRQVAGLSGAIEGTITWRGPAPAKLATACGPIEPLSLHGDRLAGALVYIEKVSVGRPMPAEGRPASVGGVIVKRGCALAPAVQLATPLPAPVVVHGDARRAQLRVTPPASPPKVYDLLEAGRVGLQVQAGVTRIDAADGSFASAWVVGLETPYYAITDDQGRFRIDELAAGTYDVTVWQRPVPELARGALVYGPPIIARRSVRVELARTARLDVGLAGR